MVKKGTGNLQMSNVTITDNTTFLAKAHLPTVSVDHLVLNLGHFVLRLDFFAYLIIFCSFYRVGLHLLLRKTSFSK